ncbi:MAG TPA: peptidoglycan-associated lipoprotein Pal [Gemmatimonadaceae bacterium]|jgi:peptidoglycan-associated lipoprotein
MTGKYRLAPAMLLAIAALAACGKKQQPAPPPAPVPVNQDSIDAEQARRDSIAAAEAARRDSLAKAQAEADRLRAEHEAALATLSQAIFFEYDSDALSEQATSALDAKLAILNANPSARIRIEGNTDDRGSDEYNLALGQRRAAQAKRYLTQRGVSDDRIEIISYGEERPAADGHDESAWSQNRRDGFQVIAGGDQLKSGR